MLFSLKHTLFLTGALALLQSAIARPLLLRHEDLIKRDDGSDLRVRNDFDDHLNALLDQPTVYKPNPTRITLGHQARKELDNLKLHGKARKNTINWHKKQIKNAMRTNPLLVNKAEKAVLQHIAHKGGSNPDEKNHITVSFTDKHKVDIKNEYNEGRHHHIYVSSSNQGLPNHVKGAMDGANARMNHKSPYHQAASGKTHTPGKSRGKGKGKSNRNSHFSKHPLKGYQQKGGK